VCSPQNIWMTIPKNWLIVGVAGIMRLTPVRCRTATALLRLRRLAPGRVAGGSLC
jgi:hypothetical protein